MVGSSLIPRIQIYHLEHQCESEILKKGSFIKYLSNL